MIDRSSSIRQHTANALVEPTNTVTAFDMGALANPRQLAAAAMSSIPTLRERVAAPVLMRHEQTSGKHDLGHLVDAIRDDGPAVHEVVLGHRD